MPSLRGSIIAVPYDYSDLTSSKVRPALIVSSDAYNRTRPDVVAAGISSQIAKSGLYAYHSRNRHGKYRIIFPTGGRK